MYKEDNKGQQQVGLQLSRNRARILGLIFVLLLVICQFYGDAAACRLVKKASAMRPPAGMVYVAGGTFRMGDTFGGGDEGELPVHQVTVSSFYMGKYEVTFAEYDAFCKATRRIIPDDNGWGRADRPAIVTWYEAIAYCNWRSVKEGLIPVYKMDPATIHYRQGAWVEFNRKANGYRLPTEAEWEYAARGGGLSCNYKYSGGYYADAVGWYKDNAGDRTHPVGEKYPNELGLYDMSGNAWEWCWDVYYSYTKAECENPATDMHARDHIIRGGVWYEKNKAMRVCSRSSFSSLVTGNIIGFRLVRNY